VTADDGLGVEGVNVAFQVTHGSGTVHGAVATSDSMGRARTQWTLGPGDGAAQAMRAVTLLPESLSVTLSAVSRPPGVWTWVAGDSVRLSPPVRGSLGVPDSSATPGGRRAVVHALAPDGTLWLYGGGTVVPAFGLRNDLWRLRDGVWTWVAGGTGLDEPGVFGVKGVPAAGNQPSARWGAAGWIDGAGHFWMFGDGVGDDLWRFDGAQWTWMAGDSVAGRPPVHGQRGVAAAANSPGTRFPGAHWTDFQGRPWLYGATSWADLWMHDGAAWVWMGGDSAPGARPQYGELGVSSPGNSPGIRFGSATWYIGSRLWLYGGVLSDNGVPSRPTDLWSLSGIEWTWVAGSRDDDVAPRYGPRGVFSGASHPGSRAAAGTAVGEGIVWIFGGVRSYFQNDLWQFDGAQWTWLAGSTSLTSGTRAPGQWGTRGVGDAANTPSGRTRAIIWVDAHGVLWLYGGNDYNDLWRYDPTRL